MIDWDRVNELRDEVGEEEFEPVLELFIDEVEHLVMQLSLDDSAQLERFMHFLKGSAWNLGFADFGARCGEIEALAAAGDLAGVSLEDLVACYSSSKRIFHQDLSRRTGHGGQRAGVEVA
ncbi:Hpt domain-containing protein [Paracoccus sp. TK19116]|uniref:Hpt domain-containing protein n=1 Tax=Paracoccus albicereus TaxID=2922394 RepID=A0ABT1MRQ8_9RHOB|nr:Hpt domain-containing protein [Paracoccus albicereus]MCQ0970886.1 Hpt domain-containing protein [Paracoccus albicereus]